MAAGRAILPGPANISEWDDSHWKMNDFYQQVVEYLINDNNTFGEPLTANVDFMSSDEVTHNCGNLSAYKIDNRLYTYSYDIAQQYDGGLDRLIQIVDVQCAADIAYGPAEDVNAGNVTILSRDSFYQRNARVITRVLGAASAGNAIFTVS